MNGTEELPVQVSHDREQTLLRKHTIFKILAVACVGIVLSLYVVITATQNQDSPATSDRRQTMFLGNPNPTTNPRIPPIDVAAPAKTETATFALG
jgi:hypothetical protein